MVEMKQDDVRAGLSVPSVVVLVFLAWTTACSENIAPRLTGVDGLPNIAGLTISAPVPVSGAMGDARASVAAASVDDSVVYVSLTPGAVPTGQQATIHNVLTGLFITVDVVQGGFDPVAIPASSGDTLVVDVRGTSGEVAHAVRVVTKRRPPIVVRTDPPPKKRDVALNSIIVVVFSEPLDPATLGTESVRLLRGTALVPGTVQFGDVAHLKVEFHPDALLASQTDYQLILSQEIRGVNGVALESAVTVPFTTASTAPATNLVFASVSVGWVHACGVTTQGAAYCWGDNYVGTLGDGSDARTRSISSTSPVRVAGGLTFRTVSAGAFHTCGVTTSGAAYCWGAGGLLGDGLGVASPVPLPVAGGLVFGTLSTSITHTCGVTTSGAAYCWGEGNSAPVRVASGLTFASVSAGGDHNCGLTTKGVAYCWGMNTLGELGTGTSTGPEQCDYGNGYFFACSTTPVAVAGGLTFAILSTGYSHTCGVTLSGAAYCWGNNVHGLLGDGTSPTGPELCEDVGDVEEWTDLVPCSRVPASVIGGFNVASLTTGGRDWFACGLTSTGAAYCWGTEGDRATGGGTAPVAVPGELTFAALSAGMHSTCGVTTNGGAYCWGANSRGELGDGTTIPHTAPVRVVGQPPGNEGLKRVEVTTVTTGVRLDPDGYGVLNDEWDYDVGDGVTVPAPTNGVVTLYLRPGGHILSLVDIAPNCSGEKSDDRVVVVEPAAVVTRVVFQVVCRES
jgi:alpha-tubulin suppressor-like RCC1 family protein